MFTVDQAYAPSFVLNCLTATVAAVVDSKLVKEHVAAVTPSDEYMFDNDFGNDWLKTNYAGSGPFKLREWRANEVVVLERNDNYYGPKPALLRVIYRHFPLDASCNERVEETIHPRACRAAEAAECAAAQGRFPEMADAMFARQAQLFDSNLSRIAERDEDASVRLIDEAQQPTAPIAPNRKRIFFTSMIFGLLLGLGAAILLENLDDSVKSPEEMQVGLGLTVLGTIPRIRTAANGRSGERSVEERLVTHVDPRSPVAEAYRSLRTNLAFARVEQEVRTIVLTSPGPADGKSTTVANLAITFAQQGQRTLLIDADLRRAVIDKLFDVPRTPGLTDVLVGDAKLGDVVREAAIPNLAVIGSGRFPPNPAASISAKPPIEVSGVRSS